MSIVDALNDKEQLVEALVGCTEEQLDAISNTFNAALATAKAEAKRKKDAEREEAASQMLSALQSELAAKGLSLDDLMNKAVDEKLIKSTTKIKQSSTSKQRKARKPKPQYMLKKDGEVFVWSGRGRAHSAFVEIKASGQLEQYKMTQEQIDEYVAAHPEDGY